jgi:hypothetical protein
LSADIPVPGHEGLSTLRTRLQTVETNGRHARAVEARPDEKFTRTIIVPFIYNYLMIRLGRVVNLHLISRGREKE